MTRHLEAKILWKRLNLKRMSKASHISQTHALIQVINSRLLGECCHTGFWRDVVTPILQGVLTSAIVICPVRMSSSGPFVRSGGFSGVGLFRTSWKCSFHRFSWSSVLVKSTPFLSLTGLLWTVFRPLSSLVVSLTFFMSLQVLQLPLLPVRFRRCTSLLRPTSAVLSWRLLALFSTRVSP